MGEVVFAYVAKKACGHYRFAAVDCPDMRASNTKEITRLLNEGWTVERVPVEQARTMLNFCDCAKSEKQPAPSGTEGGAGEEK